MTPEQIAKAKQMYEAGARCDTIAFSLCVHIAGIVDATKSIKRPFGRSRMEFPKGERARSAGTNGVRASIEARRKKAPITLPTLKSLTEDY